MKTKGLSIVLAGVVLTATLSDRPFAAPEETTASGEPATGAAAADSKPAAKSSTRPPAQGRVVGDHWTPYDPPSAESIPQGAQVHIIVGGDNLWDLSSKYLQDPWLWPQIWEVNQYITDSHWIYPGDPLVIPGKPTVIGEAGPSAPSIELLEPPASTGGTADADLPASPEPSRPSMVNAAGAPSGQPMSSTPILNPIAGESDVYCSSYIVERYEAPALTISGREDEARIYVGTGDIVFLSAGLDANLRAGDEYSIITYKGVVPHPIFSDDVGESLRMVGRLKIIALQEKSATAEITMSCDAVTHGMGVIPFEEIPLPLTTPTALERHGVEHEIDRGGYIVDVTPGKEHIGEGDIVNIDLGDEAGLKPGDLLTVFREWGERVEFASAQSHFDELQARAERARSEDRYNPSDYPQVILGQIVVLKTQKRTATAKVVATAREINLGDRVSLK